MTAPITAEAPATDKAPASAKAPCTGKAPATAKALGTAKVVPLPRHPRPLPVEAEAVLDLLTAVGDPRLRRYCLEQLGAARGSEEIAAALALTRALGRPSPTAGDAPRRAVAAPPLGRGA